MSGHVRTVAARSAGSPLRPVTRWLPRAVLVACVATLVAAVVDALSAGKDYTRGFAPSWVTILGALLGAVAAMAVRRWPQRIVVPRLAVLVAGWFGCVLLVWSAGGVLFDGLRALAVLGVAGLPPEVDWPGFAARALASSAAALVAGTVLEYRRASGVRCGWCGRGPVWSVLVGPWLGYAACVLALPYPLLKVYWALGGTTARSAVASTSVEGFPFGEIVAFAAVGLVCVALAAPWGRVAPRSVLLVAGWAPTGVLVTMGALAGFGSLAQALGLVDGPARLGGGGWVVYLVYGSWLLLGVALGGATMAYQRRTRRRCAQCGR